MDELSLVRSYGEVEVAEPVTERVRASLRAHIASAERQRQARRRLMVAVAVAVAAGLTVTLAAFGGRIYDAFFGAQPPRTLPLAITKLTTRAVPPGISERAFFAFKNPRFDVAGTRGLLQARTAVGPVDLWQVPLRDGGSCTFVQADAATARRQPTTGPCWNPTTKYPALLWDVVGVRVGNTPVRLVEGHVGPGVTGVELHPSNGPARRLLLADGYFFAPLGPTVGLTPKLVARAGTRAAATIQLPSLVDHRNFGATGLQEGLVEAKQVFEIATPAGFPAFLAVQRRGTCAVPYTVPLGGSAPAIAATCRPPDGGITYALSSMSGGSMSVYAGRGATTIELSYPDGARYSYPLSDGWALIPVPSVRAPTLASRASDGSVIETKPVQTGVGPDGLPDLGR